MQFPAVRRFISGIATNATVSCGMIGLFADDPQRRKLTETTAAYAGDETYLRKLPLRRRTSASFGRCTIR
jgi:hypothetical protein